MKISNQILAKTVSKMLSLFFFIIYCSLTALSLNAQIQTQTVISKQAESHIHQFLLTDKNNKYTTEIQIGQHIRNPEGIPVFNFNGTPALKQKPKPSFHKSGLGGINNSGTNSNVVVQRVEPKTGKPYLIILELETFQTLSKNID